MPLIGVFGMSMELRDSDIISQYRYLLVNRREHLIAEAPFTLASATYHRWLKANRHQTMALDVENGVVPSHR